MYKFFHSIVIFLMLTIFASQSISAFTMPCETTLTNKHKQDFPHQSMAETMAMDSTLHLSHNMNHNNEEHQVKHDDCCESQCSCPQSSCSSVFLNDSNLNSNVKPNSVQKINRLTSLYQKSALNTLYRPPIIA